MTRRTPTHRHKAPGHLPAFVRAGVCALLALTLVGMGSGPSMAAWTAAGSGAGTAATATLAAPTAVTVPAASASTVPVSWTAGSSPGAPSELRYYVTRTTGAVTTAACGSTPTAPLTGTSCTDTVVPDGTHTYTVTAVYRSWTARSAPSGSTAVLTATRLAFSTEPGNAVAGVAGSPTTAVRLQSAAGLSVTTPNIAITIAIATNPASGTLSGTATVNTDANGVATFTGLAVDKAGVGYTLTATSPLLTSATSGAFTVTAATTVATLRITTPARSAAASATANLGPITVEARDANGNLITAPTGGIPLAITSTSTGTRVVSSTAGSTVSTGVAITAGSTSASFYHGDTLSGSATLTIRSGTVSATQVATVTADVAARLTITPAGVSGIASDKAAIGPFTLRLQDQFGNAAVRAAAVVARMSSAQSGTATFSSTSAGPAANDVTIPAGSSTATFYYGDTKATASVSIAAAAGTLTAGTQTVAITAGAPAQLAYGHVPTTTRNNVVFSPAVTALIQDRFGNRTASTALVTIIDSEGKMDGTKSRSAVAGLATFDDLKMTGNRAFTLTVSTAGPPGSPALSLTSGSIVNGN